MNESVKPLNVSPVIKCARWTLLGLGIVYGIIQLKHYAAVEIRARPIRKKQIIAKYERLRKLSNDEATESIMSIADDLEIQEFPPGWNKDL